MKLALSAVILSALLHLSAAPRPNIVNVNNFRSVQAAIDSIGPRGGTIYFPAGDYWLGETLNLRNRRNITLWGDGSGAGDEPVGSRLRPRPSVAGKPVIDMTGAHRCTLRQIGIFQRSYPQRERQPSCGILLAREEAGRSAGQHTFDDVTILGWFQHAAAVNIGSEVNVWDRCHLFNVTPDAMLYFTGSWNSLGIESPHGVIAGGLQRAGGGAISNVKQHFRDCIFNLPNPRDETEASRSVGFVLEPRTFDYTFTDCAFTAKRIGDHRGMTLAYFRIGAEGMPRSSGGVANHVTWLNVVRAYGECWALRHFVEIVGGGQYEQITIDGRLQSEEEFIRGGSQEMVRTSVVE